MSDSRIDKMTEQYSPQWGALADDFAADVVRDIESAGLVLLDPADPAVIDRVAAALYDATAGTTSWVNCPDEHREAWRSDARAVLAALGGDRR